MRKEFKKGDKISLKKRFEERERLLKPFLKKYNQPVLVHSTPNLKKFKQIIKEGKLIFPKETAFEKRHSFVEKSFGLEKSIFFSLGFVYATAYDFKYSLLFSLDLCKKLVYYRNSLAYACYKGVVDYWDRNDREMLDKLAKKNKLCKSVVEKYYSEKYKGKNKTMFDFWKCEKELYELIGNYPKKKQLLDIIKKIERKLLYKYPSSVRIAKKDCLTDKAPEIISKKPVSLKRDKSFLGFYLKGRIPLEIKKILKKEYKGKIFFDGKRMGVLE
jgi:hypothetical protein